jgi:MFS-type transporter involved in bile tolerance (Atg22 family)
MSKDEGLKRVAKVFTFLGWAWLVACGVAGVVFAAGMFASEIEPVKMGVMFLFLAFVAALAAIPFWISWIINGFAQGS